MTHTILWALSPKLAQPANSLETKGTQKAQRNFKDRGRGYHRKDSLSLRTHDGGGGVSSPSRPTVGKFPLPPDPQWGGDFAYFR